MQSLYLFYEAFCMSDFVIISLCYASDTYPFTNEKLFIQFPFGFNS
jgi:hypothetical protein